MIANQIKLQALNVVKARFLAGTNHSRYLCVALHRAVMELRTDLTSYYETSRSLAFIAELEHEIQVLIDQAYTVETHIIRTWGRPSNTALNAEEHERLDREALACRLGILDRLIHRYAVLA